MPLNPEILLIAFSNVDLQSAKEELRLIKDVRLSEARARKYIDINPLPALTYEGLQNEINYAYGNRRITMLHYIGHSGKEGIVIEKAGEKKLINLEELANLVQAHKRFRFVFLNSCLSVEIANALTAQNVPYVIGTTSNIDDEDAVKVAAKFYELLSAAPRTIEDAYRLTDNYFMQNPGDLKNTGKFRGLDIGGNPGKNNWHIYRSKEVIDLGSKEYSTLSLAEKDRYKETVGWTLVPEYVYELSDELNNIYQKKVLCLYPRSLEKEFRGFKARFNKPEGNKWIMHGIWDIFGDQDYKSDVFQKEWEAAEICIHFIDSNEYAEQNFLLAGNFTGKTNAWLPVTTVDKGRLAANASWFDAAVCLESDMPAIGDTLETLREKLKGQADNYERIFGFFDRNVNAFLDSNTVDENVLVSRMKDIPFLNEVNSFESKKSANSSSIIYFTLIEGTPLCAQRLIVHRIRKRQGIPDNVETLRIIFKKESGPDSPAAFWKELYRICKLKQIIFNDSEIKTACVRHLLGSMAIHPVVLAFEFEDDTFSEIYSKELIQSFWQQLIDDYNQYTAAGNSFKYPLHCFIINNDNKVSFFTPPEINKSAVIVKISPVSTLSEGDWNEWYDEKFPHNEPRLSFTVEIPRKTAMIEICKNLHINLNIIDSKVLVYD